MIGKAPQFFKFTFLGIVLLAGLLIFVPLIGEIDLFDFDETYLASVSKSTLIHTKSFLPYFQGTYWLDYPPLFIWIQMLCQKFLGFNEFASRLPSVIIGLISLLTLYQIGKNKISPTFGLFWALVFLSNLFVQLYHRVALVDATFNFFFFLSLYFLARVIEIRQEAAEGFYNKSDQHRFLIFSVGYLFLALLTKGISSWSMFIMTYFLVFFFSMGKYGMGYKNIFLWNFTGFLFFAILVLFGFKYNLKPFIDASIKHQWYSILSSELKFNWIKDLFFYLVFLILGAFPSSIFALNHLKKETYVDNFVKIFRLIMACLIIVVVIDIALFRSRSLHHISILYYALSFLAAYNLYNVSNGKDTVKTYTKWGLLFVTLIWSFALIVFPMLTKNFGFVFRLIDDQNISALFSKSLVHPSELIIGISFLIFGLILANFYFRKKSVLVYYFVFLLSMIYAQLILVFFVPKIQNKIQGSYVSFIKAKSSENALFHFSGVASNVVSFYLDDQKRVFDLNSHKYNDSTQVYVIANRYNKVPFKQIYPNIVLEPLYHQGLYEFFIAKPK
ncbi:MAG: glycosyltransferase family 39 protein [Chitinophagales bacterium]|jgi:4-amino-4-deoxy-L-arabinose transferase-like glycosyltransferase|nr:glycosyltransferase family 39 protein [Chitinophagales bacterium]